MMIIRLYPNTKPDGLQDKGVREFAVDDDGNMAPKDIAATKVPTENAFTPGQQVFIGIAGLGPNGTTISMKQTGSKNEVIVTHVPEAELIRNYNKGKLLYMRDKITPELVGTLDFMNKDMQPYTIVTEDFGTKTCWSRGIEKIYYM